MADGDDDEQRCRVIYLDVTDGEGEEECWIKRAGKVKVVYPNGHTFEGSYDAEKIKQGSGTYVWMAPTSEDDDTLIEIARFDGMYVDGQKTGYGKMLYPTGDIYEGEWFQNKMQGDGSYTYKKTGDIYFGSWFDGLKHGSGKYKFGNNEGCMEGIWDNGQIVKGTWNLADAVLFAGDFKLGRPYGAGKLDFTGSGLTQIGSFDKIKSSQADEDDDEDSSLAAQAKVPKVEWNGESLVAF